MADTDFDVTGLFDGFPGNGEDEETQMSNEDLARAAESEFITHLMKQIGVRSFQPIYISLMFGIVDEDMLPEIQAYLYQHGTDFIRSIQLGVKDKFGIAVMPSDEIMARAKAAREAAIALQWPPTREKAPFEGDTQPEGIFRSSRSAAPPAPAESKTEPDAPKAEGND